jgi:hypothetical protein
MTKTSAKVVQNELGTVFGHRSVTLCLTVSEDGVLQKPERDPRTLISLLRRTLDKRKFAVGPYGKWMSHNESEIDHGQHAKNKHKPNMISTAYGASPDAHPTQSGL